MNTIPQLVERIRAWLNHEVGDVFSPINKGAAEARAAMAMLLLVQKELDDLRARVAEWKAIVRECEELFGCQIISEEPGQSSLPALVRAKLGVDDTADLGE